MCDSYLGWLRLPALLLCASALGACAVLPPEPGADPQYAAVKPAPLAPAGETNGAIYRASRVEPLFSDNRALHVGDNLTITLNENTNAKKSADTGTSRSSSVEVDPPTVLGRGVTVGGVPVLKTSLSGDDSFSGKGDSSQSNQLTGSITVTVAQVLANGNLVVQGEKWVTINQGHEYMRVRGIVRPADIQPNNSVLSTDLADARISYGGTGLVNDANRPGWLTRFFQSVFWPI